MTNVAPQTSKLLWIDLEMTGLDETRDSILEIAAIVTDYQFASLGELHSVVFQPQSVLDAMNDWCKEHHGKSGLTERVPYGRPLADLERELLQLLDTHFGPGTDKIVLAGNSIGNDRRFIDRALPGLAKRLHYRMVDVSSFKEIFREKYGIPYKKSETHRALEDIRESIAELEHYLSFVKVPGP